MTAMRPEPRMRARRIRFDRNAFYRTCRMLHAYLSAFAFLVLIFFSTTGLVLNHPDWLRDARPAAQERTVTVPAAALAAAMRAADPAPALAAAVARLVPLRGAYKSAEILGGEAQIRLEGASGNSSVVVDLESGEAEIAVEAAPMLALLNDLHRGKNAGAAWAALIDVSAVLVLALSVIGYVLFFSLRFRLATSLKLTAASLLVIAGVFYAFVP